MTNPAMNRDQSRRLPGQAISERKLEANRRNALKSTGPKTADGKARSARNARKSKGPTTAAGKARSARNGIRHGIWTDQPFSVRERAAFFRYLGDFLTRQRLTLPAEQFWALLYIYNAWLLNRLERRRVQAIKSTPGLDQASAALLFVSAEHRLNCRLMTLLRWKANGFQAERLRKLSYLKSALAVLGLSDKSSTPNPSMRPEPTECVVRREMNPTRE